MYAKYLKQIEHFAAMRKLITNPVVDKELRATIAKNLIAQMNMRGIPVTRYDDGPPDLFEFAVGYTELVVQIGFELPTPGETRAVKRGANRRLRRERNG